MAVLHARGSHKRPGRRRAGSGIRNLAVAQITPEMPRMCQIHSSGGQIDRTDWMALPFPEFWRDAFVRSAFTSFLLVPASFGKSKACQGAIFGSHGHTTTSSRQQPHERSHRQCAILMTTPAAEHWLQLGSHALQLQTDSHSQRTSFWLLSAWEKEKQALKV